MHGVDISLDLKGRHLLDFVLNEVSNPLGLVDSTSVGDLGDDTFVLPDLGVVPTCKCTRLDYYDPFRAP